MKNFKLSPILSFPEISGASGIFFKDNQLYIISDDSYVVYNYDFASEKLTMISLHSEGIILEHIQKKDKPDFESMAYNNGKLFIFGSGSKENRFKQVVLDLKTKNFTTSSLQSIYYEMMDVAQMNVRDFNIEGATFYQDKIYFFNRGNGPNQQNGFFCIDNWEDNKNREIQFNLVQLPKTNDVYFTFSDAVLIDNHFVFLATAEDTENTYDDGEVLGSAIGKINIENFTLEGFETISNSHKFEGITIVKKGNDNFYQFLICDDADDKNTVTEVFELEIKI